MQAASICRISEDLWGRSSAGGGPPNRASGECSHACAQVWSPSGGCLLAFAGVSAGNRRWRSATSHPGRQLVFIFERHGHRRSRRVGNLTPRFRAVQRSWLSGAVRRCPAPRPPPSIHQNCSIEYGATEMGVGKLPGGTRNAPASVMPTTSATHGSIRTGPRSTGVS